MVGLQAYLFSMELLLVIVCVYFTYKLLRITRLRSWWLVILALGLYVVWRLLVLASLMSAWAMSLFLLFILGTATLGLWQLERKFNRIYRHVNETN